MRPGLLVALILGGIAGSGSGTEYKPGVEHHHIQMGPVRVSSSAMANPIILKWIAEDRGHIKSLTWNEEVSGNPGPNAQSYVLEVNGVTKCTISILCDVPDTVYQSCDVSFDAGDTMQLRRATNTCAMNPSGGILITVN